MAETSSLKARAIELGFQFAGVCAADPPASHPFFQSWIEAGMGDGMPYLLRSLELRRSLEGVLPGAKSVLAVALNYNQVSARPIGQGRIARYALGRDYHRVLRAKLKRLAIELLPAGSWRVCVDSAPILEREYALRAGIGWFGKNTCLIDTKRGSWFVLGFLLTTTELEPDQPAEGGCGTCRQCIDACPTGAIVQHEGRWVIDGRKCISALTIEHRGPFSPEQERLVGDWLFGCDVCQEVCPFNQPRERQPLRAPNTQEPDFLTVREWPSLERILEMSEGEWEIRSAGSPIRRAGLEGLKRNARAVLKNAKRTSSSEPTLHDEH